MPDESAPLFLTVTRADGRFHDVRADAITLVERRKSDVLVVLRSGTELVLTYDEAKPILDHLAAKVRAGL